MDWLLLEHHSSIGYFLSLFALAQRFYLFIVQQYFCNSSSLSLAGQFDTLLIHCLLIVFRRVQQLLFDSSFARQNFVARRLFVFPHYPFSPSPLTDHVALQRQLWAVLCKPSCVNRAVSRQVLTESREFLPRPFIDYFLRATGPAEL